MLCPLRWLISQQSPRTFSGNTWSTHQSACQRDNGAAGAGAATVDTSRPLCDNATSMMHVRAPGRRDAWGWRGRQLVQCVHELCQHLVNKPRFCAHPNARAIRNPPLAGWTSKCPKAGSRLGLLAPRWHSPASSRGQTCSGCSHGLCPCKITFVVCPSSPPDCWQAAGGCQGACLAPEEGRQMGRSCASGGKAVRSAPAVPQRSVGPK